MTMRSSSISHVPVCHVVYAKFPADPRVRREVRTLESVGFTVDVLCLRSDVEDRAEVMPGVRVRRLPLGPRRGSRLRYAYQYVTFFLLVSVNLVVAHAFRRYRIIHVHSLPDFLILAAVPCRALGARLVLDLHESMPEIYRAFPQVWRLVRRAFERAGAARFLCVCKPNDYSKPDDRRDIGVSRCAKRTHCSRGELPRLASRDRRP